MRGKKRKTGIDIIGDASWGTHFCLFYQTKGDLIDILIPYFKTGLENNEFCIWITSEPLGEKEAKKAMRRAVPDFEHYERKGQMAILPHTEWYLKDGALNLRKILDAWKDKLDQALAQGYDGMRVAGNIAWLERREWRSFADYEEEVNEVIGNFRMIAICAYLLDGCGASEILDVVRNHRFALIKREGRWELLESSERLRAEKALKESEERYRRLVENAPLGIISMDNRGRILDVNPMLLKILGSPSVEATRSVNMLTFPPLVKAGISGEIRRCLETGESGLFEHPYTTKWGKHVYLRYHLSPLRDADGRITGAQAIVEDITERKRVEEKIRKEKEFTASLLRGFKDGFAVVDREGRQILVNEELCKMTGYSERELLNQKPPFKYWAEEGLEKINEAFQKTLKGVEGEYELLFKRKNGERFIALVSPRKTVGPDGNPIFFATVKDITDRKKAQEEIARAKKNLESIFNTVAEAIIAIDVDYNLVQCNPAFCKMVGKKCEEVIGEKCYRVFHNMDRVPEFCVCREAFQKDQIIRTEFYEPTRKRFYWCAYSPVYDDQGRLTRLIHTLHDITERKEAEEALRESEEYLKILLDSIHTGILVIDPETHTIVDANLSALQMIGTPRNELLGRVCHEHICPAEKGKCPITDLHQTLDCSERVLIKANGERIPILKSAVPVIRKGRRYLIESFTDITERKKAEEELRKSEEKYRFLYKESQAINILIGMDGKIIDANKSTLELLGYEKEEVVGKDALEFVVPEQKEKVAEQLARDLRGEHTPQLQVDVVGKEGIRTLLFAEGHGTLFEKDKPAGILVSALDITERIRAQKRQALRFDILNVFHQNKSLKSMCETVISLIKNYLRCEAVALRLKEGEDFPFFVNDGFPKEFVESENYLCLHGPEGNCLKDSRGHPILSCICGMVINARFDPDKPFFTGNGSFWVNSTTDFLASTKEEKWWKETRKVCNRYGYESVALIPIKSEGENIGLLQINHKGRHLFSKDTIEFLEEVGELMAMAIERKRTEEEQIRLQRQLEGLWEIARMVDADYQTLCDRILGEIIAITKSQYAFYGFLNEDETILKLYSFSRDTMKDCQIQDKPIIYPIEKAGLWGEAVRQRRTLIVNDYQADHPGKKGLPRGHVPLTRVLVTPIFSRGRIVALAAVANKPTDYTEEDARRIDTFATNVQVILDRRQAEEALRQSQQKYEELVDSIEGIVWEADAKTIRFSFVSRQAEKLLGYPVRRWLEEPTFWQDHLHPDDRRWAVEFCAKATREKKDHELEYRMIAEDGRIVWLRDIVTVVVENDQPVKLRGVMVDITRRKRAEEALRESEERFRAIFETAQDSIFIKDRNLKYTQVNPSMERLFGLPASKLAHRTDEELFGEEAGKHIREVDSRVLKGEIIEEEHTKPIQGNPRTFHVVKVPMRNASGEIVGLCGIARDITEKKKMQAQLIQAERLAAVGTLAYGIAHEFNNILAGILGNAEFGMENDDLKEIRECFQIIIQNCERAKSITNNLLAFSRHHETKKQRAQVTEAVETVLGLLERELEKQNITVVRKFNPIPEITCDLGELSEVALNMITNARDAMMPKGGTLTIQIRQKGDNIEMIFEDTGCGIPEKIKERIFEPFVTTKGALGQSETPGTGLGLYLCYGIVARYHGTIEVKSQVGKGAKFTIKIPISKNQSMPVSAETEKEKEAVIPKNLSILLVDDEKPICTAIKKFLEAKGHSVVISSSGKKGLKLFKNKAFDVVLSDITMPDMDGLKLISKVKSIDQKVKLIALTGHLREEKLQSAREAGADLILTKPFKNEDLYKTIGRVLSI